MFFIYVEIRALLKQLVEKKHTFILNFEHIAKYYPRISGITKKKTLKLVRRASDDAVMTFFKKPSLCLIFQVCLMVLTLMNHKCSS